MKSQRLAPHCHRFFPSTTRPDFENNSPFKKLTEQNKKSAWLTYSATDRLVREFQQAQGKLMIEKTAAFALSNLLGAAIILYCDLSARTKTSFITLNLVINLILLKYISVYSQQKEHDEVLVELYNRYRELTISGPKATHNPEATNILATIHAELSIHQMEPWRNSWEITDYSEVSDMFRQIRANHLHLSTDTIKVGFWDSAYMNLAYQSSLMRKSDLQDQQLPVNSPLR